MNRSNTDLLPILFNQNPRCCYCGKVTIYNKEFNKNLNKDRYLNIPDNLATVEHILDNSDLRKYLISRNDFKYISIACYKCNKEKGKIISDKMNDKGKINLLSILKTGLVIQCL